MKKVWIVIREEKEGPLGNYDASYRVCGAFKQKEEAKKAVKKMIKKETKNSSDGTEIEYHRTGAILEYQNEKKFFTISFRKK